MTLLDTRGRSDGRSSSILTVSFLVAGLAISGLPAHAQNRGGALEEITVTGIRGSLQRSLGVKHNANNFVDAISAEDIGRFPDENVAEALQRIPGVSIDRNRGEGQFATIRGLGPQFVRVTVNGRTMPSNVNGQRSFSFAEIQSEFVETLEVHKSSTADLVDGGLAGTINIKTRRPLDLNDQVINIGVSGIYNSLSEDVDPRIAALFSDTYADDAFGILVSASYARRSIREDNIDITGYAPFSFNVLGGESGIFGRNVRTFLVDEERDRINLNTSIQWQVNPEWLISYDGLYTNFDINSTVLGLPFRTQAGLAGNATAVTIDNGLVTSLETSGARPRLDHVNIQSESTAFVHGLNADFQRDRLNVNIDLAWSKNKTLRDSRRVFYDRPGTFASYDISGGQFIPEVMLGRPGPSSLLDQTAFSLGNLAQSFTDTTDEEFQARLDFQYEVEFGLFRTLAVGINYRDRERFRDIDAFALASVFGGDPMTNINVRDFPVDNFLTGLDSPGWPNQWAVPDIDDAFNYFLNVRGAEIPAGTLDGAGSETPGQDFLITEESFAGYVRADFEGEFLGKPVRGNIGGRWVKTDQTSGGNVVPITGIQFVGVTPMFVFGPSEFQSFNVSYTEFLPSLNLAFDLTDDVVFRVAGGKVLSRPSFVDLSPGTTSTNASTRQVVGGNPELQPLTAWQSDLAVEWYFRENSVLAVSVFKKWVDSFVNTITTIEEFIDPTTGMTVPDPDSGSNIVINRVGPVNEDGASIEGFEISFQTTFDNLPVPFDGIGIMANYTYVATDANFVNTNTMETFDIPGLSEDTFNIIGFYEKGPLSFRVAYNQRAKFLDNIAGFGGNPEFTDTFRQIDANISYDLNDHVSLFVEAININDEGRDRFNVLTGRELLIFTNNTGRRFFAGVRATF